MKDKMQRIKNAFIICTTKPMAFCSNEDPLNKMEIMFGNGNLANDSELMMSCILEKNEQPLILLR